jgi:hypothetical protein
VLISRITQNQWWSRDYDLRYIVTFSVMTSSFPIIAVIDARWGFDGLSKVLSAAAACVFISVSMLPRALSEKRSL